MIAAAFRRKSLSGLSFASLCSAVASPVSHILGAARILCAPEITGSPLEPACSVVVGTARHGKSEEREGSLWRRPPSSAGRPQGLGTRRSGVLRGSRTEEPRNKSWATGVKDENWEWAAGF